MGQNPIIYMQLTYSLCSPANAATVDRLLNRLPVAWRAGFGSFRLPVQSVKVCLACTSALLLVVCRGAAQGAAKPVDPRQLSGLITFWNFQEQEGNPRRSIGPYAYELEERNGPIPRLNAGVWGPYSTRLKPGQWFRIERKDCPALNLRGPNAQYTILAWIQRLSDGPWQYIAGVWDETRGMRQYSMFTSGVLKTNARTMERTPVGHRAHAYISSEGGGTLPYLICMTYATGATELEKGRWYFLAATYDQKDLRMYVDGKLDSLEDHNPYPYNNKPIFDGGTNGADFTVGQRSIASWKNYPNGAQPKTVSFDGVLGGLAVYDRALTAQEIAGIHAFSSASSRQ